MTATVENTGNLVVVRLAIDRNGQKHRMSLLRRPAPGVALRQIIGRIRQCRYALGVHDTSNALVLPALIDGEAAGGGNVLKLYAALDGIVGALAASLAYGGDLIARRDGNLLARAQIV